MNSIKPGEPGKRKNNMVANMKYRLSELAAFLKREFIGKDVEIYGCNTLMDAKDGEK